jgi:hypothetical protein
MIRAVVLLFWLCGCNGNESAPKANSEVPGNASSGLSIDGFRKVSAPYALTDTALLGGDDTAQISDSQFSTFIPDSLKVNLFEKGSDVTYFPLAQVTDKNKGSYLIVKARSGKKVTALMIAVDPSGQYSAALPFLQPDTDPATQQISQIDKSYTITRSVTRRIPDELSVEGKDVYVYNPEAKSFTLIMTDRLDNDGVALINPIDTLSRNHRFAGDYTKDKNNIVSIRDAPNPAEFNFFIHIEKGEDCTGELKGTALMTSSKTAVFRQGGNPCVMNFSFSGSSVTITEAEGCGSQRSVGCTMDGSFSKKKEGKDKTATKKLTAKSKA